MTRIAFGRRAALAAAATLVGPRLAHAAWPERPVRFVVGFPPGSATDIAARALAEAVAPALGQPVVVENRGGASGNIAANAVRGANDGHTLLVHGAAFAVNPTLFRSAGYTVEDFRAIAIIATTPAAFIVRADSPARNLGDLLAMARARPLDYASSGAGTVPRLGAELLFRRLAQVEVQHVAFPPAQAVGAVAAGHVPMAVVALPTAMGLIRGGQVRAVAVGSARRDPSLPDVPTVAEQGFPDFDVGAWNGLFAPHGFDGAGMAKLEAACAQMLATPALRARLATAGLTTTGLNGAAAQTFVQREARIWGEVVRFVGVTVD
ncbi:tripartite tricarboxylate transporter substrate binding protein [Falsiroseomonas sp.]|uniref:tripartite tricarboxylate transporter substrate binding protein n=1 Tax=Falsiroseomonas sp. TaxID=2870721 RepID=UPI003567C061